MDRQEFREALAAIDAEIRELQDKRAKFAEDYQATCKHEVAEFHHTNVWGDPDPPHWLCLNCGLEQISSWTPERPLNVPYKDRLEVWDGQYAPTFYKLGIRGGSMSLDPLHKVLLKK